MPSRDPQRVDELFQAVLPLPPEERGAFLSAQCRDPELRQEVERLLATRARLPAGFMETPAATLAADLGDVHAGAVIDERFELQRQLGEGGVGVVWLAHQIYPIQRDVALKLVKIGLETREVIGRFEAERNALSLMDDPRIAHVYDAGVTERGRPYFVMEYVQGAKITDFCDQRRLSVAQRLALFVEVCQAVQHAHQKGVIHRDLKPSNILVTLLDGKPLPKVIDFGIAKAAGPGLTEYTLATAQGQLIGTPEYMSPEQADLSGLNVDTRADIYSLGALLYELLTGAPPFDPQRLRTARLDEMLRTIRQAEPLRPSARLNQGAAKNGQEEAPALDLAAIAVQRRLTPAGLVRAVQGDLDWIVLKCLEKDRARRYETANGLAADIRRHLAHEPVIARRHTGWYVLSRHVRRYRLAVGMTLAFVALLASFSVALLFMYMQQTELRGAAEDAGERARQNTALAMQREAQTRRALEFQSALLGNLDPQQMGHDIMQALREQVQHRLTETWVEDEDGEMRRRSEAEVAALLTSFDEVALPANPTELARRMLTSGLLEPAEAAIDVEFADEPLSQARLLSTLGAAYGTLGHFEAAERHLRHALALQRQALGADHVDTTRTIDQLATILLERGEYTEAESLMRLSLDIRRRALPAGHPDIAGAMEDLGHLFLNKGELAEALAVVGPALEMQRAALGHEHPGVADVLATLALIAKASSDYPAAEAYYREALAILEDNLPAHHQRWQQVKSNYAVLLQAAGDYSRAEQAYTEVLQDARQRLGEEHPVVAARLSNLAALKYETGDYAEAEQRYRQAIELLRRLLGPRHPDLAVAINNLAVTLWAQGQHESAEALYREALAIQRATLGDEHPHVATAMNNLGQVLLEQRKFAAAEEMHRRTLALRRRLLGEGHLDVAQSLHNLGLVMSRRGDYAAAVDFHRQALEAFGARLAPHHPHVALAQLALGAALKETGDLAGAEEALRASLGKLRTSLGEAHPHIAANLQLLGGVLLAREDYEAAEPVYAGALEMNRRLFGPDHVGTILSASAYASVLTQLGCFEEAARFGEEAVARARAALAGQWQVGQVLLACAEAHWHLGRFPEAEAAALEAHAILKGALGDRHKHTIAAHERIAALYAAWHAAEPDAGHEAQAAVWQREETAAPPPPQDDGPQLKGDTGR